MLTTNALRVALRLGEETAARALTASAHELPPSASGLEIAERGLNFIVDVDPALLKYPPGTLDGHCRRMARYGNRPSLWVCPAKTEEDTHFRILHEVAHYHLEDQLRGNLLERACNRFAAACQMRPDVFRGAFRACNGDLFKLKEFFPYCSFDSIAIRIAELFPSFLVCGFRWYDRRYIHASEGLWVRERDHRDLDDALAALYRRGVDRAYVDTHNLRIDAWQLSRWHPHHSVTVAQVRI